MTASARGSASIGSSVRRTVASPSWRHSRSTSAKRSGMARRKDEQRVAARRPQPVERADDGLFLALERAAGHEHGPVRRHAEESQHALAPAAAPGRRGHHVERVELQAAGDGDARRIGAERDEAPRGLFALDAEPIDIGQHAPEERTDQPVARKRSIRDAAVHEDRLRRRAARHSRSRFGQISVSIITKSRGLTRSSVRRTVNVQSNGK